MIFAWLFLVGMLAKALWPTPRERAIWRAARADRRAVADHSRLVRDLRPAAPRRPYQPGLFR